MHDSSFTRDPHFISAYEGAKSRTKGQEAYQAPWRVHMAMWAAETALSRSSGDFVECGVWRGFVSCAAIMFVNWNSNHGNRTFFLVELFSRLIVGICNGRGKEGWNASQIWQEIRKHAGCGKGNYAAI
jgi:hypothetical protein